jgi:curved DNA-binding protein
MDMDNHYTHLGVAPDATAEQIKAAYRRQVRRYHPDVSKEADAADKIKLINEAYCVLGNPDKRQVYDRQLNKPQAHSSFEQSAFSGDLHDLFEHLFAKNNKRAESYLSLTLEQAFSGGRLKIEGSGFYLDIPAGIAEGDIVRAGTGETFEIRYAPHARFQWQGPHIIGDTHIPPWIAAVGGKIKVDTLGGEVEANLPAGLKDGQRIRLTGRGMPGNRHRHTGDHWCVIHLDIPSPKTAAQKKAYTALEKAFKKSVEPKRA